MRKIKSNYRNMYQLLLKKSIYKKVYLIEKKKMIRKKISKTIFMVSEEHMIAKISNIFDSIRTYIWS